MRRYENSTWKLFFVVDWDMKCLASIMYKYLPRKSLEFVLFLPLLGIIWIRTIHLNKKSDL